MTARLKRLETMVREMMDGGSGSGGAEGEAMLALMRQRSQGGGRGSDGARGEDESSREEARAQLVLGKGATTTYVGATHFMAMLDDVSVLFSLGRRCRVLRRQRKSH